MTRLPALYLLSTLLALGQQLTLDQAWSLIAKGQRQEAVELLQAMVQKQPGNADARLLLGSLLVEVGNCSESIAQLSEGVRLRPKSAEAANALGEGYRSCGLPKEAQSTFALASRLNPAFGPAQLNLGQSLLESGDKQGAGLHLDRAIKFSGSKDDAAEAHYLRAKIYSDGGAPKQAAEELERAIASRPDFAEAWSDLGQARELLSDDKGAIAAYTRAVQIAPADAVAQYRLGSEYLHANDARQAISPLQAAYRLNPSDQSTLNALQSALRQSGQISEANEIRSKLQELLRDRDRQSQNALTAVRLNNEGAALEKSGDINGALGKYREAAKLAPDHNGIRVNLAVALLRSGNWTEGLNQLHEAAKHEPNNQQLQAALRDALSQAPPALVPQWADSAKR